jgi:hypothetical protein
VSLTPLTNLSAVSLTPVNSFSAVSRESGEEDLGAARLGYQVAAPTQQALCLRLALLKGKSWLRAATLDDSKTPIPVLHNTSVVV